MESARKIAVVGTEIQGGWWSRLTSVTRIRWRTLLALIGILLIGAYFRFTGLDWDQNTALHPDELFLRMVLSSLERPASLGEYFNTAVSRWNPHNVGFDFFVYGTLPVFMIRFISEVLGKAEYSEIYLVGRALSGIFDLLTVLLLFFIARWLYGARVALLASALSAATVLQIQLSHFMTVDTFATTFAMLTFLFAVFVSEEGKLWQYLLMGFALGMAVASRINLVLLGAVAVAAAGLHVRRVAADAPTPQTLLGVIQRTVVRLILAGIVSLVAFRIFQPYAFAGPGLFGIHLNEAWLQNMREIQGLRSGEIDYPPSHQWTNRPAYLFPWSHMVLWGMGLPLGLAGWLGLFLADWADWQTTPTRTWRNLLPVVWVLVEFGYQGRQFTKNMRYFLPIYPILTMMAAFLLVWLWDNRFRISDFGFRISDFKFTIRPRLVPGALLLLVVLGTYLWAFAFTRIYTRPVTRVTASYWIYDHVPSAATIHYETSDGAVSQTQVPLYLDQPGDTADGLVVEPGGVPYRTSFTPVADGRVGMVKFNQLQDLENDRALEVIEVSLAADPTGWQVLATRQIKAHLEQSTNPQTVNFDGLPVQAGRRYYLLTRVVDGGAIRFAGQRVGLVSYQTDQGLKIEMLRPRYVLQTDRTGINYSQNGSLRASAFKLSQPGLVRSITMNYLVDPIGDLGPETFQVMIAGDAGGQQILAQAEITAHMEETDNLRGEAYTFNLPAIELEANREYFLITRVLDGAPVQAWSSVIANEYWDNPIPLRLDDRDGFGMYLDLQMHHYDNDNPEKLDRLIEWLDQADYIMITSNRLYGSIPRLPMRYPITTEYYRLLFQEQLGFKLEKTFTSYPNIGPIQVPDQSAEESFTVYDHPKVWIFRKTDDFSPARVRAMLADEAKGPFIPLKPIEVTDAPEELVLPPDTWIRVNVR